MPVKRTPVTAKDVAAALSRSPPGKSFAIKTFGCQMNVYDSERMVESLLAEGYVETHEVEAADLVLVNTCHIREKAAEKVYSDLGRLRQIKEARLAFGRETLIAVTGCVAQAEGAEIVARQSAVDLVIGPQSYHQLPELLHRVARERKAIVETDFAGSEKFEVLPQARSVASPSAFLTIQEGCDRFCTFCVVPYTRGMEISRPVAAIEAEAHQLAAAGAVEITLLGQNVNGYHGVDAGGGVASLATLIRRIGAIEGVKRIRYTTSHPRDMADDLIAAHQECGKLMPFLHLPVQSGADRILAAMNRKHTAAQYLEIVARLRAARPDIAFSSDFIVGFPGETDTEFEDTLALIEEVGFAQSFSFKYSPRPGTPAASFDNQIPEALKDERLGRLQALLESQQRRFNGQTVGKTVPVMFERQGREPGYVVGRTPHLQMVHVEAEPDIQSCILPVKILESRQMSLRGVIQPA